MSSKTKTILKYLATLVVGILLLWYFLHSQKDEDLEQARNAFIIADYSWVGITILLALFEKVVRAYRWNILMEPLGHKPPLKNTFIAVMIGYFANIFAPRMGEVARCAILNNTDSVPVNTSFGTVVSERVLDFICLLLLIATSLLFEYNKIMELLSNAVSGKLNSLVSLIKGSYIYLITAIVIVLGIFLILYIKREKIRNSILFQKVKSFFAGVLEGFGSIRKINRKAEFFICTALIWTCYFLMTYLAFFALPSTSSLGIGAGLIILVVGGLGMAAPVQGGMVTFHAFVQQTLHEVYNVDLGGGLSYAFLVHTSQTASILLVGTICFIISFNISKKNKTSIETSHANF